MTPSSPFLLRSTASASGPEMSLNPQNVLLALLAIAAGTLFPVQASVNSLLAKSVGGAIVATWISITVSWFLLLGTNMVVFRQLPSISDIAATPLYLLVVGGSLGAIFLGVNVMLAPRLGAAAMFGFIIAGQLMAALTIDRLGLFAFDVRELSVGRIVGVALVIAGAIMVRLT
jgi:bacterial/archaeal transporter family-2 protein